MIYETRPTGDTAEARLVDRFTEGPQARARRIARRVVDAATADVIRRALGMDTAAATN